MFGQCEPQQEDGVKQCASQSYAAFYFNVIESSDIGSTNKVSDHSIRR
jgi:hypothetical protein